MASEVGHSRSLYLPLLQVEPSSMSTILRSVSPTTHQSQKKKMSPPATSLDLLRAVDLMQYTQGMLLGQCQPQIIPKKRTYCNYLNPASATALLLYEFGEKTPHCFLHDVHAKVA